MRKIRTILSIGVAVATLITTDFPYSFAKEGQSKENELQEISTISTDENEQEVHDYVYTTKRVNIRTYIGMESEILVTAIAGTRLERIESNVVPGWDKILINETEYYIASDYVTIEVPENEVKSIEDQIEDSKISEKDLRYMSAIIWAEAGNQCEAGQQAVGIVVMERVESDVYEDTIYDVIYEPGQFTPVSNGSFKKALLLYDKGELPSEVIEAAKYVLNGNTTVKYNDIVYDLNDYLYFSRYIRDNRIKIQDHMFK